jgi:hypothetical protein
LHYNISKLKMHSNDPDKDVLLVQRQGLQLHFFGSKIKNFQMHMTVGIKEDLKIKTENIMLYRFNDVFFPDSSYYNSDPLPVEWIEVFQESSAMLEQKKFGNDLDGSREVDLQKDGDIRGSPNKLVGRNVADLKISYKNKNIAMLDKPCMVTL